MEPPSDSSTERESSQRPEPKSSRRASLHPHYPVVDPQQKSSQHSDPNHCPPHHLRTVQFFAEVMHQPPAEFTRDERSDTQRQERESHVRALLTGGRQPR